MTITEAKIKDTLRAHGFRCTEGRVRIFSTLQAARRPLSHTDILKRVGRHVNRVTVYRVLEAFTEAGMVHRAFVNDRTWVFELPDRCTSRQCHPHFTCNTCGKVTCLTDVVVPLAKRLPKGYVAERQKVHIEGTCAACAAK